MDSVKEKHYWKLLSQRRFTEAVELLSGERGKALAERDFPGAAAIGVLLASTFTAAGKDSAALDALYAAQADSPEDALITLRLASFLYGIAGRPEEAFQVLSPLFPTFLARPELRHAAQGLMGAIKVSMGFISEGHALMKAMLQGSDLERMDTAAYDFMLVNELVVSGHSDASCQEYLERIIRQARLVHDEPIADRAARLLRTIAGKPANS